MPDYVRDLRKLVGSRPLLLVAACTIVQNPTGAILPQRNAETGRWGIPGGAMELGETLEETAQRELHEETGLTAHDLTLIDLYSGPEWFLQYPNGDQAYVVGATFLVTHTEGNARPDGIECDKLEYFAPTALPPAMDAYNKRLIDRCLPNL
ncbi:NUDIX domain-containing protein [Kribbella sp. NPDC056861]|uniref:NUDIX hydrolase n=1 Tax=Kribbella sp. NPDC056861 TaxID=3154857 RepID=UPI00342F0E90